MDDERVCLERLYYSLLQMTALYSHHTPDYNETFKLMNIKRDVIPQIWVILSVKTLY